MERVIGRYDEGRKGPLVICFGAMHGNEKAGLKAIDLMLKMLEVEPITNEDFVFNGRFIGVVGHLEASKLNKRFIKKDLNRLWEPERIQWLA
ncbi:MAG: succinylglutamate desuccinylase/aspartoacylase family protein, partial [Saprospiraceae bacterium]|nr:succinylglutamate desuccinylase/aspartoacylase family protein [Saprospiraceae bacterium]